MALIACETPTYVAYQDLIAEGRLFSSIGDVELQDVHCPDLTRFGLLLRPREELSALVRVGDRSRLQVGICADGSAGAATVTVEVSVPADPDRRLMTQVEAGGPSGGSESLDLASWAGSVARIRIHSEADQIVALHDVVVTERRAAGRRETVPQVLLVSVDTLRDDAFSAFGGDRSTPHLDRFVEQSETWRPHYATDSWTKPSHAGLLTGQLSRMHRAGRRNGPIRAGVKTLAGRFRDRGFLTAARIHDVGWLDPKFGFARGFDEYRQVPYRSAKAVRQTSNWIAEHRDQPFFFFLHLFDVHSDFHRLPYEAPGITMEDYGCRQGACASQLLRKLDDGSIAVQPGELERLESLYQGGLTHLDRQLGALFENLAAMQVFDDMMIVLTSDHGEAFEGPGRMLHAKPWEEILRVPLVVKWPASYERRGRQSVPTSAVDVAATLADVYSLEASDLPGRSLLEARGGRPIYAGTTERVVIHEGHKAVFRAAGGRHLFDLANDPREERDLSAERPELLARLEALERERAKLDRKLAEHLRDSGAGEDAPQQLSAEQLERLRALGYVD